MKLVAVNIRKQFADKPVLDKVSLQLETGEILGLFGRNGSGKSTLMKILFGSMKADSGEFYLDQRSFEPFGKFQQQQIAYLPQQNMYPRFLKVRDLIPMTIPEGEIQDKVFYSPGIDEYTSKWVHSLSEGQRTHLGVVLSCYLPHPVLMLDEPFSMTDPKTIERIKEIIIETSKSKALILSDHYYKDVLEVSSKNSLLKEGQLFNISGPEALKSHEYTR